MKELFGILAVVIGVGGGVPYIYSILKGTTRPHRVSWAIWATLGLITLSSYLAKGAHWSALLAVAAAFNSIVIFVISLKLGVGGTSKGDRFALALGMLGVFLWALTRQASFALVFAITADAIGTFLTVQKSYRNPRSESALAWSMGATASLFGLLAVQSYTFAQTIYPVYALIGGLALALTTIFRQSAKKNQKRA